ncbi:p25-alpha [Diplonema papillatum]|nr:p25-alpha [Diplonema papillatum]
MSGNKELKAVFDSFCAFGGGLNAKPEMDNSRFNKFCKDAGIIDGRKFTSTDADLIFTKSKGKGERRISYSVFASSALEEVAKKKAISKDQLVAQITAKSSAPSSSGTQAENVALHDDKSLYTGVYSKGGPTSNDLGTSDLSFITNREDADVRGVQIGR